MEKIHRVFVLIIYAVVLQLIASESQVKLTENGYTGVLIAIEPTVPEDPNLIDGIKRMITEASQYMLPATRQRAYFKEVTILVPKSWNRGSYGAAQKETYSLADIRIAPPNPNLGNNPYAWTFLDCGEGGEYIHLTPDYVAKDNVAKSYGPRGRVIVHEWGHYRWGVFDEYPTTESQKFYINSDGEFEATRCSGETTGTRRNVRTGRACAINTKTGQLERDCRFTDDKTQPSGLRTSIMYKQFLSHVTTFCHDGDTDSDDLNTHNADAPNNQNTRCDHRSTWDVIKKSVDFQNGEVNPPNLEITDTTPEFKVVRLESKRLVLVMDVSGSMAGLRLERLRAAAVQLILNSLSNETYVGLVSFESTADVLAFPTKLTNTTVRKSLIKYLPSYANGGTGIGEGILTGITALQHDGKSQEGGTIIVLTDGEENQDPMVANITDNVTTNNVTVHAIFLGLTDIEQDASLADLCEMTSGTWSYVDDEFETGSQLTNVFSSLSQDEDGDSSNDLIQISNQAVKLVDDSTLQFTTAIDGSVGDLTTFTFSWSSAIPTVEIKPPDKNCIFSNTFNLSGRSYCTENPIHQTYHDFKSVVFTIPGTAAVGRWQYNISVGFADTVTITVVSASSGEDPITVKPRLTITSVDESEATVVVAEVFQNYLPVLGATVTAKVVRPTGSDFNMTLLDNGAGADVKKNDGVYSKYFSAFNAKGRYLVEVFVSKKDDGSVDTGASAPSGSPPIDPDDGLIGSETIGAKIKGDLERVASSPGLQYTGNISTEDIFPPNKITDLSVSQVNLERASDGIILEFTAPGDDFDYGNASNYEIRYTYGNISNLLKNFTAQLNVDENSVTNGNLSSPKPALSKETFILNLTDIPLEKDSVRIIFGVLAYDEVGNPSKISNIVITIFFNKPPVLTNDEEPKDNRILIYAVAGGGGGALVIIGIIGIAVYCRKRQK